MDRKRVLIAVRLLSVTTFSLLAALSPRAIYSFECWLYSRFVPVYNAVQLEPLDAVMILVAMCFALLAGFRCWRASSVLSGLGVPSGDPLPTPLHVASLSVLSMPIWLTPLINSFGKPAVLAGAVLWMFASLSTLCYVGALAACEVESRGEEPGTLLLSAGYHLGGAPGVYLARKLVPGSKTLAELAKTPPLAAVYFAVVVIVTVLVKMP